MIRAEQIPMEVVEAACRAYTSIMLDIAPELAISEAIAAALSVWPGAYPFDYGPAEPCCLVLPLPQKEGDA